MAAEFVGGALLSSFLQVTFDRLASHFVDYFRGRKLNKSLLSKLKVKLLSIDALADDAEQKQFRDPRVRDWLLKAKDVVFEAEDLLDEIDYELSKFQVEAESQSAYNKVWNSVKSSVSSFENEIESRIEQVLDDLDDLVSQKDYLGLKKANGVGVGSGSGSIVSQKLPSTYLVVESVIYGRDDDKEMIFDWLTSDIDNRNKLSILSILGMGGVGKTTLAQHVYNDPRIKGKFDIKAWVCVSDDFDVFSLTRTILEAITGSTDDSRNLQMVHQRLKNKLTGKKFLLVLDDVWNEKREEWEAVETPLINSGAQGSRILVTTRSKNVVFTMRSEEHRLEQLQGNYCWQLFAKHAFQNVNPKPNSVYLEIGMKIVERCKGLPLALKTMGSLLHNKSSVSEWESVLKNEIWELVDGNIVPALALSYHHLPSHLKRCFACCALFPKDYLFDKECLIRFWMAQKFLQSPQQSKSPEEVGEQYFNDLLSRSFFQQSDIGYKTCFVMHDLLNDLTKYVCGDICFRLGVDQAKSTPETTRHFSIATNHVQNFDGFEPSCDTKKLRTFMPISVHENRWNCKMLIDENRWHCKMLIHELFSKLKFICVLSLSYSDLKEVPDSVGDLKLLHSLDLSHTAIKKLPDSTCSLSNLQILKLNSCKYLEELPSNFHKLTNLHCLELIDTLLIKAPVDLGKLKNLQVLMSEFNVGKSREFSIQQLGELNLRGSLSIRMLQNIENPSDASAVDLKNKTHLVELDLKWEKDRNPDDSAEERDEVVIENLQPSKHLEKLSISNYGGTKFPSWLSDNSLSNVVSLRLVTCKYCLCLPHLGLLPVLKDLVIERLDGIVSIDADFYGNSSSSFTSLETLEFSSMKEWEKWEAVTGAFPRLQYLSIYHCPKLKGHLPEQLLHLKELHIYRCKQLLGDHGTLKFDGKELTIKENKMEAWLVKLIEQMISNTSLEYLSVSDCLNMNIPMSRRYDFLVSLKIIDGCDSLTTLPLDLFPTLRCLSLRRCRNLQKISQEHAHNHLETLTIIGCPQFELLPERMHILLPSLYELNIEDCPEVELSPDGSLPSNLKKMKLGDCSKLIASMKGALGDNPSLKTLDIIKLDAESSLDEGLLSRSLTSLWIQNCGDLKELDYKDLCHLSSLKELVLFNCSSLQCLSEGLCHLSSLEKLVLKDCPSLQCLPEGLCHLSSLKELSLGNCRSLRCLPEGLCHLSSLKELALRDCPSLQCLSEGLCHLPSLRSLYLDNCPSLQCLPEGLCHLSSLELLSLVNCPSLQCLPEGLCHLSSLKELVLFECSSLQCLSEGLCHLSSLEELYLYNCPSLQCLPEGLCHLSSLKELSLDDCPGLQCLPEGLCHLSSLEELSLGNCRSLRCLPEGLCHLSSLTELVIYDCPSLQCLPEEGLPKSISSLFIWGNSPLLKQRCRKPEGEDWPKIAHIQYVFVDPDSD